MTWRLWLRNVALLTLGLGATVAASWILLGGSPAFRGPDRVLQQSWPAIYGSQAIMAATVGWFLGGTGSPLRSLVLMVAAAWLGELAALTLGGNLLANEIDPELAWFYWLMGTGGPIQPTAAVIGAGVRRFVSDRRNITRQGTDRRSA